MQLSKSEYIMFLKHPAWLWLKKHDRAKLPPIDDNTQAIFDAGNLFEAYAEKRFPDGLRLGFSNYNEYLTLPEATTAALAGGAKAVFQGRFEYGQITCICDVVQVVGDQTLDLYEIKSSTEVKEDHVFDLAFQMVVLESCGYEVRDIYVIHVDSHYVRAGEVDFEELTTIEKVTESVQDIRRRTKDNIARALKVAASPAMPDPSPAHVGLGAYKDWLKVYRGLVDLPADSIYDLCRMTAGLAAQLEARGITTIAGIPEDVELNEAQRRQAEAVRHDRVAIQHEPIREFLSGLEFPLYFFDYETLMSCVPYFDGLKPYTQLPFQYSLHVLERPDGELKHYGYLHTGNTNPALPLSQALETHIGDHGSVVTWNMMFEKSCNSLLGGLLPEYAEFYERLSKRIVDLIVPFRKGWYVDRRFMGSASIKNVLPVLAPNLSYKVLGIQEGGAAQRLWMEAVLDGKRGHQKDQILTDLLEYCKLDTLAMVEIYRFLCRIDQP